MWDLIVSVPDHCLSFYFDMPTNVGPTYGMYVGPTSYQCYMSNMSYVGATLRQHVGPSMAQRANLRWANVVCQRLANGVANQKYSVGPTFLCYLGILFSGSP